MSSCIWFHGMWGTHLLGSGPSCQVEARITEGEGRLKVRSISFSKSTRSVELKSQTSSTSPMWCRPEVWQCACTLGERGHTVAYWWNDWQAHRQLLKPVCPCQKQSQDAATVLLRMAVKPDYSLALKGCFLSLFSCAPKLQRCSLCAQMQQLLSILYCTDFMNSPHQYDHQLEVCFLPP